MEHRYDPMRDPRAERTEEDMLSVLAKHLPKMTVTRVPNATPGATHEREASVTREASRPQGLQWQKPESINGCHFMRSVCGRYVIAKTTDTGKAIYTASMPKAITPLGSTTSADAAKKLCEEHASK